MVSRMSIDTVLGRVSPNPPRRKHTGGSLRVLVLGDVSGWRDPAEAPAAVRFHRLDIDNFDRVMAAVSPRLVPALPAPAATPLGFTSLEDFEPDALLQRVPVLAQLMALRGRLGHPASFAKAAAELQSQLGQIATASAVSAAASAPAAPTQNPAAAAAPEDDAATLARLLGQPASASPASGAAAPAARAAAAPASSLDRLLASIMAPHVQPAQNHLQQPMVDALDHSLAASLRQVLRDPAWQGLEGRWRALDHFVRQVDTAGEGGDGGGDGSVVLELVDLGAAQWLADLQAADGDSSRTPLAQALAARQRADGQAGQVSLLVSLFDLGPSADDLAALAGLGALATHLGAGLLAGADAALLQGGPAGQALDLAAPTGLLAPAVAAHWQALCRSALAPRMAVVWPRVLARLPYGQRSQPVAGLPFEELGDGFHHGRLLWRSAALDAAALLAQAFLQAEGEAPELGDWLDIEDLPAFVDRSSDPARFQAVAERFLSEREAAAIHAGGLLPLLSHRQLPQARLAGWHALAGEGMPFEAAWALPD